MFQGLNNLLVVRGPKQNTVIKVRPHQSRVQGDDHLPDPAGYTIPDTSQDAVGLLGHLGTLPAHVQTSLNKWRTEGWKHKGHNGRRRKVSAVIGVGKASKSCQRKLREYGMKR